MAAPELAVAKIKRFLPRAHPGGVSQRVAPRGRGPGNSVIVVDCRPLFQGKPGEWTRMKLAQLRFNPGDATWALYWADRNSRWHRYDDLEATDVLDEVLAEIDADPTCIFFG